MQEVGSVMINTVIKGYPHRFWKKDIKELANSQIVPGHGIATELGEWVLFLNPTTYILIKTR